MMYMHYNTRTSKVYYVYKFDLYIYKCNPLEHYVRVLTFHCQDLSAASMSAGLLLFSGHVPGMLNAMPIDPAAK